MSALLLPLILLLLASAFFSASETALFSLEPHEVEGRGAAFQREALAWCRRHARQVLFVILFSNLAINVLYFALAASLSHDLGGAEAALVSLGAFFALIFLAEILPKSIALGLGPVWALATAPVLYFWTLATSPVTRPATMFLHFLGSRLVVAKPPPSALGEGELVESVRRHPERFGLEPRIAKVVSEVMDAADLQVRELMVPLVDFERLPPETTAREALDRALARRTERLLVGDARGVEGYVDVRDLLVCDPATVLDSLQRELPAIPEMARLHHLLVLYRRSQHDCVLVVDEYGEPVGLVGWEDLVESLLGEVVRSEREQAGMPVRLRPGRGWEVSGSISIADFEELFDVELPLQRNRTLGGWCLDRLGHVPEQGERIEHGDLVLEVLGVSRGRVVKLLATKDGQARGAEA